ncbi:TniB family NTP-binding protein, partial [Aquamicrobium sp.]|uniref:TniB family NTP-binding protein n=1 Tax=Aquamicrobium sp. TaxID=1872579 RepID=UPI0025906FD6
MRSSTWPKSQRRADQADQEHIPVLVVQMPSEPSVIRFYVALLAAMGAPLRPRPRLPE